MKKLVLVRHAKSDWNISGIADRQRPLNQRGYSDADLMSNHLKKENITFEKVITSPAVRAYSTALIFADTLGISPAEFLIVPGLYDSSVDFYLSFIQKLADGVSSYALFAHNPDISSAVSLLTGSMAVDLPTCAISVLTAGSNSWKDVGPGHFKLEQQFFPKNLKQGV